MKLECFCSFCRCDVSSAYVVITPLYSWYYRRRKGMDQLVVIKIVDSDEKTYKDRTEKIYAFTRGLRLHNA